MAPTIQYHSRSPYSSVPKRRHDHPVGAAGELVLGVDDDGNDIAESQRRHGQVVPFQPQDRPGDGESEQTDEDGTKQHGQKRRPTEKRREDRRGIGAESEEPGMTETDLTGVSDQQIQANADDPGEAGSNGDVVIEVVGQHQWQTGDDGREDDQSADARAGKPGNHTRSVPPRPSKPWGMKNSTRRISTKAMASLYSDEM